MKTVNWKLKIKRSVGFFRKNYIITIFIACILFVGVVVVARSYLSKPTYIYVKVKVGQGLWWATTAKPATWYVDSVNKGDVSLDILGKPEAKILFKKYYQWYGTDQYDVYLNIYLKVGRNKKTGEYTFNRAVLAVGSPIEVQFPKINITGTVISLSEKQFEEKLVERTIYLSKRGAFPWELEAIKIGDSYFNGEEKIFEVIDKSGIELTNLTWDAYGNNTPSISEPSKYITVKAKVKMKQVNGQWILGEDQPIISGRAINISTPNFVFDNYIVSRIE
ncbi:MAG: hypothetical protein Q7T54_02750 [Candidatus Levybacteria bacterium]|nr:hypothetical protein [Candidatus Levybacteria bacterium]